MESDHTDDEDKELDEKMNRLLEMFPQLTKKELLEVSRDSGISQANLQDQCCRVTRCRIYLD